MSRSGSLSAVELEGLFAPRRLFFKAASTGTGKMSRSGSLSAVEPRRLFFKAASKATS